MQLQSRLPFQNERIPKSVREWYTDRSVTITGGAGFIGSRIAEALVHCGAQVTIIDDFSTGDPLMITGISGDITVVEGSITDRSALARAVHKSSIIFHTAARTSVAASWSDPRDTWHVNVTGTTAVYEAAREYGALVVFSSSAAVYGNHEGLCTETLPTLPTSPYGLSKKIGEELAALYANGFGLTTISLRYFNVYGPRPYRPGVGVVNELWDATKHGRSITVRGDGMQTRDFIFVDDIATANLCAGARAPRGSHSLYNVGTGTARSLKEVLALFDHSASPIRYLPELPGDIRHSRADCTRLAGLIG
jgi:UDP-glucose 4-epimerase